MGERTSNTIQLFHGKDRRAMEALISIYGGDSTDNMLNTLHGLSARLGIASGVDPERFAAGVKHHWDFVANALNDFSSQEEPTP